MWQYDAFGAVIGQTVTSGTRPVYTLTLVRDGQGRVTLRTERVGSVTHTRRFAYSAPGRLTAVTDDGRTTTYAYDANGNLTHETRPDGSTIAATYDGRDALTRRGTTTYTCDTAGRLATATAPTGSTAYTYDRAGHLLAVTPASGPKIQYVLDATGRRIGTKVGGALVGGFAYIDRLRPAAELDATGTVTERFVYGLATSAPTYVVRDGRTLLLVSDDVGTPRLLVDAADGSVVEQLQTDALGRTTSDTHPGLLAFGFAGGLADPNTGLLHFGARDYDPAAARWTAPDPLGIGGGDPNLYRYAAGDPVNRIDPAGLACDVFSVGLSGSVGWGGGVASAGLGLAVGGADLGLYTQQGAGLGTPGFGSVVTVSCLDEVPPAPGTSAPGDPLDALRGEGATSDLGPGYVGVGGDASYSDGSQSLVGGHYSVGFQTPGVSAQATGTQVICLTCWSWPWETPGAASPEVDPGAQAPPVAPEKNPGSDDPLDGGVCEGSGCVPGSGAPGADDEAAGLDGPGSNGDPHLRTADAVHYDFMAAGEFTALRSESGDLVVQVRQVPLEGSRSVAVNSAAAIDVAGDRLTFATSATGLVVTVNGAPFFATTPVTLPKGGVLTPEDQSFLVAWADHSVVRIMPYGSGLNVALHLSPGRVGTVHGLLGPDTGKPSTTIEAKDGTQVEIPANDKPDYQELYRVFGDSWRISAAESLFDYAPGTSTASFDDRSFPDPNAPAIPADQATAATALCTRVGLSGAALADCTFDVATTGDAGFAVTDARSVLVGPQTLGMLAASVPPRTVQGDAITVDGPAVDATIATASSGARFTFAGTGGQKVYLAVIASTLPDDCGALTMHGPDGTLIGSGCIVSGTGFIDATTLPTTGQYSIAYDPRDGAAGDIQVLLTSATDQHGTITLDGPAASGDIRQSGASATFTFAGIAGQKVFLDIPSSTLPGDCGAVTLRGPGDVVIGSGCLMSGFPSIEGTVLPSTGTYSIVVDPGGDAKGDFQLRLHT